MNLKEYQEKIKAADKEEIFILNNQAIADDEISAKDFGQIRVAVDNRKRDLKLPQYISGQRIKFDD